MRQLYPIVSNPKLNPKTNIMLYRIHIHLRCATNPLRKCKSRWLRLTLQVPHTFTLAVLGALSSEEDLNTPKRQFFKKATSNDNQAIQTVIMQNTSGTTKHRIAEILRKLSPDREYSSINSS
ncbi:hypothetical protein Trydic_g23704 [Trypoxylus dichotomus]